jgi:putative PEP-CTERM system histidine kinase
VDSDRGELWLLNADSSRFEPQASFGDAKSVGVLNPDDAIITFMHNTRWVVDSLECRQDPEKYANAFVGTRYCEEPPSIYVPLMHDDSLLGLVRLARPPGIGELSYEDHDLLKTAGQQAVIFLLQERNQEALAETRQFEAFSRLTAFLMHDLKNLISQQELVVGNARRFRDRPEFIDDAIQTMDSSVKRMRKVLERLQSAGGRDHIAKVDVARVVLEAAATCADREPRPMTEISESSCWVTVDPDKLAMALTHAIRNAQDASEPTGQIIVRLTNTGGQVVIEVEDTGAGMDEDFVRLRLFKPFESTKGAQGMGIGAFQIRETLRAAGGDVIVTSEPDRGTVFRMTLPRYTQQPQE